jgi:TolA-binding protein
VKVILDRLFLSALVGIDLSYNTGMKKMSAADKQRVKELNTQIKGLQAKLVQAEKLEGKDLNIEVKIRKNQARFKRVKKKDQEDKAFGVFFLRIDITAEQEDVYIPLSVASGKKVAGFMYQIEGTAAATIDTADVRVQGEGVTQVSVGTIRYAKIPPGSTASFEIRASIRGSFGKVYKLVFTRLNYKLELTDIRYQQYLKELHSLSVTLS